MNAANAVESLWKAGFRANASTVSPNHVVVLDPVVVMSGSKRWTEYKRVELHVSKVSKFLSDRS